MEFTCKTKVKPSERPQINCSDDAYGLFKQVWEEEKIELVEKFKALLHNRANKVLGMVNVS